MAFLIQIPNPPYPKKSESQEADQTSKDALSQKLEALPAASSGGPQPGCSLAVTGQALNCKMNDTS